MTALESLDTLSPFPTIKTLFLVFPEGMRKDEGRSGVLQSLWLLRRMGVCCWSFLRLIACGGPAWTLQTQADGTNLVSEPARLYL